MEDKYLWLIEGYETKKSINRNFPNEKLGVGDKLILNKVIRNNASIFKKYDKEVGSKVTLNYPQHVAILKEMEKYGFTPFYKKQ